jgi:hypothetical protein
MKNYLSTDLSNKAILFLLDDQFLNPTSLNDFDTSVNYVTNALIHTGKDFSYSNIYQMTLALETRLIIGISYSHVT